MFRTHSALKLPLIAVLVRSYVIFSAFLMLKWFMYVDKVIGIYLQNFLSQYAFSW